MILDLILDFLGFTASDALWSASKSRSMRIGKIVARVVLLVLLVAGIIYTLSKSDVRIF